MAGDRSESENLQGQVAPPTSGFARTPGASTKIKQAKEPTAEEVRQLLRKRALALAKQEITKADSNDIQIVEFMLGQERYAVEPNYVDLITFVQNLIPLPCTPSFVRGVISVRGAVFPVIDLMKLFEPSNEESKSNFSNVIVLQSGEMSFGVLADAIRGVRNIAVIDIKPYPAGTTERARNYFKGMTSDGLTILDAQKLLTDESLVVEEHGVG